MRNTANDAYRVGNRRPPLHTRFQKGRSGNPSGRPKGHRNLAATLAAILGEQTSAAVGGLEQDMTKLEAVTRKLVDQALAGDNRTLGQLLGEIHKNEAKMERETSAQTLEPADLEVLKTLYARLTRDALAERKARKCAP